MTKNTTNRSVKGVYRPTMGGSSKRLANENRRPTTLGLKTPGGDSVQNDGYESRSDDSSSLLVVGALAVLAFSEG